MLDVTAKKHDVRISQPEITLKIEEPRAAVKEFRRTSLDDTECFDKTLKRLESDVETMQLRANAWAVGSIVDLQNLPYTDNTRACLDAVLGANVAEKTGMASLPERIRKTWLEAAEAAIAKNRSTFALLPVSNILDEKESFIAELEARGYTVEAP